MGSSGESPPPSPAVTELELHLLLEAVHRVSGFDFREYAPATLKRRVAERVRAEGTATITGLLERVLHEPAAMARFVEALTHNAGSPFREPGFFAAFRERVLPRLRTFPHVRIWVIGAGEDAYSLAILLREAELYHRVRIYATDASDAAVERGKTGSFAAELLDEYAVRYADAGGTKHFSDYVELQDGRASFRPGLREQIVFAQHNLTCDGSFNEFHLVVARNVLTHFSQGLSYRAHQVIFESLIRLGYLGLSAKETLRFAPHARAYEELDAAEGFYRRMR
ncbi:MAG: protein-glutamate O-methyltransferase CheR [Candidatus Eremiobacteraeota bacterium]|nr:protein-glutamate O-methyltransferase CheR [Candidatus Eremiobacteraeota bacterium]MBV9408794.1 protein-glutamate O-methyltransferase CheR [Candidatus Eremiobacteraeota bacterium]